MSRPTPISVEADPASTTRTDRVRGLNDAFRRSFSGGHVMLSRGSATLPEEQRRKAEAAVQAFAVFGMADDPHGNYDSAPSVSVNSGASERSTPVNRTMAEQSKKA